MDQHKAQRESLLLMAILGSLAALPETPEEPHFAIGNGLF